MLLGIGLVFVMAWWSTLPRRTGVN
jgi:hypothetical protein